MSPRSFLLVPLLVIALLAAPVGAAPQDAHYEPDDGWPTALGWSEYGGSLERTGRSPASGPQQPTDAVKPVGLNGRSFSAPVLDRAGHVFVGDITGKAHRYTPELEKVWSSPALGGEIRSSVLVDPSGTVYVAPVAKELVALDGMTGKVKWRFAIGNTAPSGEYVLTGAPAWHPDGFVIQGSMDGKVYAITPDGKQAWTFQTHTDLDNKVVATAAVGKDGTIYIGSQNSRLYALTPDGKEKWSYRTTELTSRVPSCPEEQQVAAPSLDDDGTIYVGTRLKGCGSSGKVYALNDKGDKAEKKWSVNLADKVTAPVTVGTVKHVYVGAIDGTFYALAKTDGKIAWSFRPQDHDPSLRNAIGVSLALSAAELAIIDKDDRIYVPYWNVDMTKGFPPQDSLRSPLYALDGDGKVVWRKILPATMRSPALMPTVDGKSILYVAGDDARLYAFGSSKPVPPPLPTDAVAPPEPPGADEDGDHETGSTTADSPAPGALLAALVAVGWLVSRGAPRRRA